MTAAVAPEQLALQEIIAGRYSIEHELGRGGMGIVFLARDVALERPVAIKLLPPQLAGSDAMRQRFVREARTAARLSHPNIVPIHSVEEHGDVVFFVMGYIDGETLAARVRRAGPLAVGKGSKLIQELAWALAYAHSAGVIHRDVKPDNVLIDRASGRAMLTDFGIARVSDGMSITGLGEIVGTAQFVSPEQASGGSVDARSDLYSLGVTGFFALTGRLPFEAPTLVATLAMHLTQPAPPVATLREGLPSALATSIDRCLAKDPADRFRSGEELADAIGVARAGEREVAPAIRAFLRDRARVGAELFMLYVAVVYLGAFHVPFFTAAGPLSLLALASVAWLVQAARRLLRAGYRFADVRVALQADILARREELGIANLTTADEQRMRKGWRMFAFGMAAAGAGVAALIVSMRTHEVSAFILGAASVIGGAFLLTRASTRVPGVQRQGPLGRFMDQLWQGRFGKVFFTLAGLGLGRDKKARDAAEPGAHTEVLLANAAEELFAALPASAQALLGPGRDVVDKLEAQIAKLRRRETQLASALAEAGEQRAMTPASGAAGQALGDRRLALTTELEQARRDVAGRRASAIAALENIRLQLLRLRVGLGSPSDLTADLEAARDIERQISALIEVTELGAEGARHRH
jgi:hypothetical protein